MLGDDKILPNQSLFSLDVRRRIKRLSYTIFQGVSKSAKIFSSMITGSKSYVAHVHSVNMVGAERRSQQDSFSLGLRRPTKSILRHFSSRF